MLEKLTAKTLCFRKGRNEIIIDSINFNNKKIVLSVLCVFSLRPDNYRDLRLNF